MAKNIYRTFLDLLPSRDLQVGTVIAIDGGVATVELPGGGVLTVRGEASVDDQVFVRDGVIEAPAPNLSIVEIEI